MAKIKMNLGRVKGDKGDKGEQGLPLTWNDLTQEQKNSLKGEKGDTGAAGRDGRNGQDGVKGDKGDKGDAFRYQDFTQDQLAALKGATGERGPKGDTGEQGIAGPRGEKGDTGDGFTTEERELVDDFVENFEAVCEDPNIVRLSGRIVNTPAATTTAAVNYKGSGNGDTYRVTQAEGNTALRTDLIALCVKCPAFSMADGSVEQVMTVEFIPSTADFALSIVPQGSSEAIASIPWVDGVTPTWQTGKVYSLCISRQGVSVSYRSVSSLYNE